MDLRLLWAFILAMLPVSELRGGLPLAIIYAKEHGIPILLVFLLILMANILVVFFVFYFLDRLNHVFLKNRLYKLFFENYIKRLQKKIEKFKKSYSTMGFVALSIFVAVPLPGTGAWTGCLLSWLLNLDRKKSILSISIGVAIAGVLMLFGTLGFLRLFS